MQQYVTCACMFNHSCMHTCPWVLAFIVNVWTIYCCIDLIQVLAAGGPYPLVVLPVGGEYWLEGSNHRILSGSDFKSVDCKIETNNVIQSYRRDFMGKVWWLELNWILVVMSVHASRWRRQLWHSHIIFSLEINTVWLERSSTPWTWNYNENVKKYWDKIRWCMREENIFSCLTVVSWLSLFVERACLEWILEGPQEKRRLQAVYKIMYS